MHTVTINEAKTHLSRLLQECLQGNSIIIAKGKKPIAKLTALHPFEKTRRLGAGKGTVTYIAKDFDHELDDFVDYAP
jgi:antitoxin (DNA-binding transcriptional repressor) of toxin-antitoxin stability system